MVRCCSCPTYRRFPVVSAIHKYYNVRFERVCLVHAALLSLAASNAHVKLTVLLSPCCHCTASPRDYCKVLTTTSYPLVNTPPGQ